MAASYQLCHGYVTWLQSHGWIMLKYYQVLPCWTYFSKNENCVWSRPHYTRILPPFFYLNDMGLLVCSCPQRRTTQTLGTWPLEESLWLLSILGKIPFTITYVLLLCTVYGICNLNTEFILNLQCSFTVEFMSILHWKLLLINSNTICRWSSRFSLSWPVFHAVERHL